MISLPLPPTIRPPYQCLYADPPWSYRRSYGGLPRYGGIQYDTLSDEEIYQLPVASLCDRDCFLFLWATFPKLVEAIRTVEAWGFRYVTVAFVWIKTPPTGAPRVDPPQILLPKGLYSGLGSYVNGNAEIVLLGIKGKPKRYSTTVKQVYIGPVGRHSRKPLEIRERITALLPPTYRALELFARPPVPEHPQWDATGLEYDGYDIRHLLEFKNTA